MPTLRAISVGVTAPCAHSRLGRSAIDKRPVEGAVRAFAMGLAGDEQADRRHHGGIDQAVYAFAAEDLERWSTQLGRTLRDGQFGENLTTVGIDLAAALIGERWRIGTAEFEVSLPRIPCQTFQGHLGERGWVRRFTADARSGAYLRVLVEGELSAGDAIDIVHRPDHEISTAAVFRALSTEPALLAAMLDVSALPAKVHAQARAYLARSSR
ncbi:MAG: MOSC domain-containing protein [Sporichthyaceae bacterium]